jgi:hypothetical protein
MGLLNSYLKAVRMYLPKAQREDIIQELSENLLSQIEEKEAALGRPLTEDEEEAILLKHGDPLSVASRYGSATRGVSFGVQLIGPEIFPFYKKILLFDWIFTACVYIVMVIIGTPITWSNFLVSILAQFVVVTVIFTIVDRLQRNSRQHWSFPPTHLQPIPRWQSISGIVLWSVVTIWWIAVPHFPWLLLGSAAGNVKLAPVWGTFYAPILLLWLAGLAQRCINLIRPQWNWLLPVTRLATNGITLAMQHSIWKNLPAVMLADGASNPAHYKAVTHSVNALIQWGLLSWFWMYLAINALWYLWLCIQHIRHWIRQRGNTATTA